MVFEISSATPFEVSEGIGVLSVNSVNFDSSSLIRTVPIVKILIDGESLESKGWSGYLKTVSVTSRLFDMSYLDMTFEAPSQDFFSGTDAIAPNQVIEVLMGWEGIGLVKRGIFKTQSPTHEYAPGYGLETVIRAISFEGVFEFKGESRGVYNGVKSSNVIRNIADNHGIKHNIYDTKDLKESIAFSGVTLWEFMQDEADKYGYSLWVDHEGTLNFRPFNSSFSNGSINYGTGANSNVSELSVSVAPSLGSTSLVQDRLSLDGKTIKAGSASSVNGGADYLYKFSDKTAAGKGDIRSSLAIQKESSQDSPIKFIVGGQRGESKENMQNKLDRIAQFVGMSTVVVTGRSTGLEFLGVGQTVPLNLGGIDEFSGPFLIKEVTHTYDLDSTSGESSNGYTCDYTLARSFLNQPNIFIAALDDVSTPLPNFNKFISSLLGKGFDAIASLKAGAGPPLLGSFVDSGNSFDA